MAGMIEPATCRCSPGSSRPNGSDRSQWSRWRARACYGALGRAMATAVWRRADHQHSQCRQPALARVAWQAKPLHRAREGFPITFPRDILNRLRPLRGQGKGYSSTGHKTGREDEMATGRHRVLRADRRASGAGRHCRAPWKSGSYAQARQRLAYDRLATSAWSPPGRRPAHSPPAMRQLACAQTSGRPSASPHTKSARQLA